MPQSKYKTMPGSEDGVYTVFGQRGKYGIGFRVLGLRPGDVYGDSSMSHFGMRLRSAEIPVEETDAPVKLADVKLDPASAWPALQWEKINSNRASLMTGMLTPGSLTGGVAEAEPLLQDFDDGTMVQKVVAYLHGLIAEEYYAVDWTALSEELQEKYFSPAAKSIREKLEEKATVYEALKKNTGKFATSAELMAGVKKAHAGAVVAGDGDEPEDESEEDHND